MGTVYLAHDPVLNRLVAIKLLTTDLDVPDARDRFHHEAKSAASVNHANIVVVHEFGEHASQPYIVMEYVVGESLAEVIRRKAPATLFEKLRWVDDLCAGVASAHEKRILHRDLKPTNLMVDRSSRLKIVDFGIARILGTLGTTSSRFAGTPGYMAPEQIRGEPIDVRADLFSIGAVCYELLSYTEAFPGETSHTISHRVLHERPAPLLSLVPDLDPALVAIVERALAKSPDDRFPDVSSLRDGVDAVRRRVELQGIETDSGRTPPRTESTYVPRPSSRPSAHTPPARPASGRPASSAGQLPGGLPQGDGTHVRITGALNRARALLDANDIDAALTACEEALSLDDANPEALEIEKAIRAASAGRRVRMLLGDARRHIKTGGLDTAAELLRQARGLNAESVECSQVEAELRTARAKRSGPRPSDDAEQTIVEPRRTPNAPIAAAEETVVLPRARTPVPPATPMRREPDSRPGGPDTLPRRPSTKKESQGRQTPTLKPVGSKPLTPGAATSGSRHSKLALLAGLRSRAGSRIAIAVAVIAAAALVAALALGDAEVPTGTVVIDAAPWGTVTSITAVDGTVHSLPEDASTPLLLTLDEGQYHVTIAPPNGNGAARTVTVAVTPGGLVRPGVETFPTITVDEYFEQYLTTSTQEPLGGDPAVDPASPAGAEP
jgi:serine/threonine-protein kinase